MSEGTQDWRPDFAAWPPAQARRWRAVLAHGPEGDAALLADQHENELLLQLASRQAGQALRWHRCGTAEIDRMLGDAEQGWRALSQLAPDDTDAANDEPLEELDARRISEEPRPALRWLGAALHDALQDGASDLHLERTAQGAELRLRRDGVLLPLQVVRGADVAEQMVARLKVLAELDIGERRLPQDGRFRLRVQGRAVDFRLSILPASHGEDAVVRVLDRGPRGQALALDALGFDAGQRVTLRRVARLPHGMLLATGPTGSGKTTTLYALMAELNGGREKIITIEDPVEVALPGVVQIPVNEKKGLGFARGLRSILRHDPDRIMVGEIRDTETAHIAVQASLTGHLVLSSVHANHAFDVVARLIHMGLDPYHVVAALEAVLAQRLLRQNCPSCTTPYVPADEELQRAGLTRDQGHWMKGSGCAACHGSGSRGRRAVAELLVLDDELRDLIVGRAPITALKAAARARGIVALRQAALAALCQGLCSFDEVERVAPQA